MPSPLVGTVLPTPVATFRIVTMARGIAAPEGSLPVPVSVAPAPKEGALNTYLNREPTDTAGQLALMQQNNFRMQLDTTVLMFLLQYGSRIHMDRTYYPANTKDREMIPCYVFTPANAQKGTR